MTAIVQAWLKGLGKNPRAIPFRFLGSSIKKNETKELDEKLNKWLKDRNVVRRILIEGHRYASQDGGVEYAVLLLRRFGLEVKSIYFISSTHSGRTRDVKKQKQHLRGQFVLASISHNPGKHELGSGWYYHGPSRLGKTLVEGRTTNFLLHNEQTKAGVSAGIHARREGAAEAMHAAYGKETG